MSAMLDLMAEYKKTGRKFVVIINGLQLLVTVEDLIGDLVTLKEASGGGIYYAHYSNIVISAMQ